LRDQLLRKEKDEASPTICFRQDSLNAFIPRLAEVKAFLFKDEIRRSKCGQTLFLRASHFKLHTFNSALVSQPKTVPHPYLRSKIERSAQ
jgi:hypothetical protein